MTWLQLSAGRGPGECQMAVKGLLDALIQEARQTGVRVEVIEAESAPHGLMSALVSLSGDGTEALAASWEGTVRWTCPSPLRPGWRRKNWYVGVSLLSPPSAAGAFRDKDLRVEAFRASGPGGQHVNTTDTAVRVTHLPTGLVATAREERSQHRNKALAIARLAAMIAAQGQAAEAAARSQRWSRHDALMRGNECRAYEGIEFRRSVVGQS